MGAFEDQVKMRALELKQLFKKGIKVVGKSCKKGWSKVKNLRQAGDDVLYLCLHCLIKAIFSFEQVTE
ncbi:unnamed protein product [Arabidopsis halleri]